MLTINKIIDKYGCYKVRLLDKGEFVKDATFFPANSTHEKVVSKIYEAYHNFSKNKSVPELQKNGKYLIQATTNEGIEINMFITKNGKIVSAYPLIK